MTDNLTELERMVLADLGLYGKVSIETAIKSLEDFFTDRELLYADGRSLLIMRKAEQAEKHLTGNPLSMLLEIANGPDIFWERYYYQACHDPITYEAAIYLGVKWLAEGSHIPKPMSSFFAGVLSGRINNPAKRGPKEGKTMLRDWMVCEALQMLDALGVPPTKTWHSKKVTRAVKPSGCDLVAEVLKRKGFARLGPQGIEKIWKSRKEVIALVENKEIEYRLHP